MVLSPLVSLSTDRVMVQLGARDVDRCCDLVQPPARKAVTDYIDTAEATREADTCAMVVMTRVTG
jgi:hypothetical protein